jgi:DMSO/TMAO reductase YedYZ molybdopterin-dependent catalytic subunit
MRAKIRRAVAALTSTTVVTAVFAGIAAVAGSFAAAGLTADFAFTPVSSVVVHYTPGVIINTTLEVFGDYGKYINMTFTLFATTGLFVGASAVALITGRLVDPDRLRGARIPLVGVVTWGLAFFLTSAPALSLGAGVPAAAVVLLVDRPWQDELSLNDSRRWPDRDRRRVLQTSLGVVGFAGASYFVGNYRTPEDDFPELDVVSGVGISEPEKLLDEAAEKSFDLDNSPDLVTELGSFYTVDITTIAPRIDSDGWELDVTGAVDSQLTIPYDELTEMETEHRFSTLRCVGEDLNSRKMDNAVWTGIPASDISEQAGARGEFVAMRADDDYWNVIPREVFEQSYIVYGMNGHVLPREHGHPVRVIVPGHWGETNVKWLQEIEFLEEDTQGYWEERGWEGTGEVCGVTKIWTTTETENGVLLGGQAYDGTDGVDRVEISLDGGETWTETETTEPLSTGDSWRQWRYEVTEPGDHEVVVRLVDNNGEVQESEESESFPDGATGWVSESISV